MPRMDFVFGNLVNLSHRLKAGWDRHYRPVNLRFGCAKELYSLLFHSPRSIPGCRSFCCAPVAGVAGSVAPVQMFLVRSHDGNFNPAFAGELFGTSDCAFACPLYPLAFVHSPVLMRCSMRAAAILARVAGVFVDS